MFYFRIHVQKKSTSTCPFIASGDNFMSFIKYFFCAFYGVFLIFYIEHALLQKLENSDLKRLRSSYIKMQLRPVTGSYQLVRLPGISATVPFSVKLPRSSPLCFHLHSHTSSTSTVTSSLPSVKVTAQILIPVDPKELASPADASAAIMLLCTSSYSQASQLGRQPDYLYFRPGAWGELGECKIPSNLEFLPCNVKRSFQFHYNFWVQHCDILFILHH